MIIGLTGPAGSGKDTAAAYISEKHGFYHGSGGDVLRQMLRGLGLDPRKEVLGPFGVFVRRYYGNDEVTKRVFESAGDNERIIYSGFRSLVEAQAAKDRGAVIVYIDAPSSLRYARIGDRARTGDIVHKEHLEALDAQEQIAESPEDENLAEVRAMADIIITNDGTFEELYTKIEQIIESMSHERTVAHAARHA